MATHSSILAWRIPWTEEPGRLQSMGSQRIRHNWQKESSSSSIQRTTEDRVSPGYRYGFQLRSIPVFELSLLFQFLYRGYLPEGGPFSSGDKLSLKLLPGRQVAAASSRHQSQRNKGERKEHLSRKLCSGKIHNDPCLCSLTASLAKGH